MKKNTYFTLLISAVLAFSSCKPEDVIKEEELVVPTSYSFENSSFSGQTTRLDMLSELVDYIETANAGNVTLDENKMINMYKGSDFENVALNTSGKQLYDKTSIILRDKIENYLKEASTTSSLNQTAGRDTSGISNSTGTRARMLTSKGIEYSEFVEKSIMAATFMDQALNNYLANFELDDNSSATFKAGEGTAMQHHWDEAYGYFTDSKNFPREGTTRFWSGYSNRVDPIIYSNKTIGIAFRTGRAAINAGKIDIAKAQREVIKKEWTKLAAAMAIRYLNSSKTNFSTTTSKLHTLTEAYGFVLALKVAGSDVDTILNTMETTSFYDLTELQLTEISNSLADQFGLKTVQSSL